MIRVWLGLMFVLEERGERGVGCGEGDGEVLRGCSVHLGK